MSENATQLDRPTIFGIVVCGICVAAFSSYSQFQTARTAGVTLALAWVLPVATDATAFVATRVWLSLRYTRRTRLYAAFIACACMALSFGSAAIHLVLPALAPWQLRLAVGGLPSLALAALAHLGALIAADHNAPQPRVTTPRKRASIPAPAEPIEVAATSVIPEPADSGAVVEIGSVREGGKRAQMMAYLDENPNATGAGLDHMFGTSNYGRGVLRAWQRQRAQASGE